MQRVGPVAGSALTAIGIIALNSIHLARLLGVEDGLLQPGSPGAAIAWTEREAWSEK